MRHCVAGSVLPCTLLGWGREEVKVPLTKAVGLKACARARWLVSQPTSGLVTCPAHWKQVTLQPWGCAGVPLSPWALESAK